MLRFWFISLLFMIGLSAQAQSSITGLWLTEDKEAHVEVVETEAPFQGKLVWVSKPKGQDKLGTRVFRDLKPTKSGWEGTIYSVRQDDTYDATFQLIDGGKSLEIKIKVGFLTKTQVWQRIEK